MTLPPDLHPLATALRETFGPLRLSGPLVGKPLPPWTDWPSHTAEVMARHYPYPYRPGKDRP